MSSLDLTEDVVMDPGGGAAGTPGGSNKKSLQDMSKEELIQKCKGLLTLAQRAKVAKDGKCLIWSMQS